MKSKSSARLSAASTQTNTLKAMPSGVASLMNGTSPPNRLITNDTR